MTIWTIGHSTRSLDEFTALLAQHDIEAVADVRRHPGSRKLPWFAREQLEISLPGRALTYRWIETPGLSERTMLISSQPTRQR